MIISDGPDAGEPYSSHPCRSEITVPDRCALSKWHLTILTHSICQRRLTFIIPTDPTLNREWNSLRNRFGPACW